MTNSKTKGKSGELEVVHKLREHGFEARRGQQYSGTEDSPDVVWDDVGDFHIEVKRTQQCRLYEFMDQALMDAGDKRPVVFHRKNKRPWVAILSMDDFLQLVKEREKGAQGEFDNIEF